MKCWLHTNTNFSIRVFTKQITVTTGRTHNKQIATTVPEAKSFQFFFLHTNTIISQHQKLLAYTVQGNVTYKLQAENN